MKTMNKLQSGSGLLLALVAGLLPAGLLMADDIEIYRPADGSVNLLVDLDMSGSMCFELDGTIPGAPPYNFPCYLMAEPPMGPNTRGGILLSALNTIIDGANNDIHMGLTRFGWTGLNRATLPPKDVDIDTAHGILLPVKRLGDNSQTIYNDYVSKYPNIPRSDYLVNINRSWKDSLKALLAKDFKAGGNTPIVDSLYETYLYFNGDAPLRGGLNEPLTVFSAISPAQRGRPSHPLSIDPTTGKYISPKTGGDCEKNVVVLLSDGQPTVKKLDSRDAIKSLISPTNCANASGYGECGPELAGYMHNNKGVDVYTVGFALNQDANAKAYLDEIANSGGGKFFLASNEQQLIDSINSIIDISTRSSSFSTPSLSASTSPFANDPYVYLQLFTPTLSPRWRGNIKKYKIDKLDLLDKNHHTLYDANGILNTSSVDYWNSTNQPDGGEVNEGGFVSKLDITRINHVYVEDIAGTSLVALDSAHTSAADFHVPASDFDNILAYTQGVELDSNGAITNARRFIGDPLHSRLVPVTYDTGSTTRTVMYFGTNEGYLHAVELGEGSISGNEGGSELFAFMPRSLLKNQKYFKANSDLKIDTDQLDNNGHFITKDVEHIYGLDGEIQIWFIDSDGDGVVDTGESVYLSMGMRRGGRDYYILNISDPEKPTLYMHIRGGQGAFADLGQTWAAAKLVDINTTNGSKQRVLILAGGYDDKQDNDPTPYDRKDPPSTYDAPRYSTGDNMGNDIFLVAFDGPNKGQLLWHAQASNPADMKYSFAGGVATVDTNGDHVVDRLYAADTGGQVWRIKLDNPLASPTVDRLIDINDDTVTGNRRFYYEPSVSFTKIAGVRYFNIAIGSGYRAHPLNETIENRFYLIRDDQAGSKAMTGRVETDLFDATSYAADPGNPLASGQQAKLNNSGWYVELEETEHALANPVIYEGNVFFSTYIPPASGPASVADCEGGVLGEGYFYALSLVDASPPFELVDNNPKNLANRSIQLNNQGIPGDPTVMIDDHGKPLVMVGGESIKDNNGESPLKSDAYQQEFWIDI